MDTKVIAMVGAVIVVGAAVYGVATGTVLPGTEDISEDGGDNTEDNADDTQNVNNGGSGDENDDGDSEDQNDVGDGGEPNNESDVETVENTEDNQEELPQVCEDRESDISREEIQYRRVAVGPTFDPIKFESMLHDSMNKLRNARSNADPLKCDPELRDIARKHSELVVKSQDERYEKEVEIKSKAERYEGVCENPIERRGTFYYQRDMQLDPPSGGSDQRTVLIEDHEEMVTDIRGKWGGNNRFINDITDSRMTRQGVGAYIDRRTRKVVVTHVLCGDRSTGESGGSE